MYRLKIQHRRVLFRKVIFQFRIETRAKPHYELTVFRSFVPISINFCSKSLFLIYNCLAVYCILAAYEMSTKKTLSNKLSFGLFEIHTNWVSEDFNYNTNWVYLYALTKFRSTLEEKKHFSSSIFTDLWLSVR